jgi:hypothetical protein
MPGTNVPSSMRCAHVVVTEGLTKTITSPSAVKRDSYEKWKKFRR